MQTKRCSKCQKDLLIESFRINRSRRDGRQTYCVPCDKLHQQEHYQNNKDAYKARTKESKEKGVAFVRAFKEGKPCTDCKGTFHPFVMDFDHLQGKIRNISLMAHRGVSLRTLAREMAKCELVCANCHRMRTLTRTQGVEATCKVA